MTHWTEEHEVFMCKLRLTRMTCAEVADVMTQRMDRRITKSTIQGRLHKRGITIIFGVSEIDNKLMCVVVGEKVLEDAINEEWDSWQKWWHEEHCNTRLHPGMEQSFKSDCRIRYEQLKWQHEHLRDVPTDPDEWPAYRAQLEKPPGPPCWRCKDELVIRHLAGRSSICPACMDRPSRRKLLQLALQRTIPRARYRNAS